MLYLEDYLEMIEHLPHELKDRFNEMKEMDLHVHNEMDAIEEKVKVFFSNAKKLKTDQRDSDFDKLKQEYEKTLEEAEEKVELANQIYDLVEKYLKRLDSELQKFKMELEADNSGITEILERRSLELDNPPNSGVNNNLREKRKHSHNDSVQGVSNPARSGDTSCSGSNHGISNNLNNNWVNQATFTNSLQNLVTNPGINSNGNPMLANTIAQPHSPSFFNVGAGNNAIAAAATQAIAATQQMQQGRRSASLKASYDAINPSIPSISCDNPYNPLREGSISSFNLQGASGTFSPGSIPGIPGAPVPSTVGSGGEGSSTGLYKTTKRSRTSSSQYHDTDESSETMAIDENGAPVDWTLDPNVDPNEPRYCLCNQVSYGDMVACDNADCQYEWFHYGCVGITQPPKGKWFCPPCNVQMKRKNRKEKTICPKELKRSSISTGSDV